jgi:CRISPR-associated protein Cmr4
MNQASAILGLIAETSLHAGCGSSVGAIDLPIQREGHNGWPCVFGSALKGSLRSRCEQTLGATSEELYAVFGPDTKNASEHAGALAVGDARLLLLPVRSLTSAFKWVTCPEALKRLARDAKRLGSEDFCSLQIPDIQDAEAFVAAGDGLLFLEEYRFSLRPDARVSALGTELAKLMKRDDGEAELRNRLTLVSDNMFSHLVHAATPVNAHVALDAKSKTARDGALWYEETLPPETLLYAPLVAARARRKDVSLDAPGVLAKIADVFTEKYWLQIGGNETVGMGWCAVSVLRPGS